jgi:hypothetical protein
MTRLFVLPCAMRDDPRVSAWFTEDYNGLRVWARPWFDALVACGADVTMVLHDGHPTVCVADAAFAYIDAFTAHVNLGFYQGAALDDPAGLLHGTGKWMRHVKLHPGRPTDEPALHALIAAAYHDIHARLAEAEMPARQGALPDQRDRTAAGDKAVTAIIATGDELP